MRTVTSASRTGPRHAAGFWAVSYAFLVVMAFSAIPTPLYALYRARDGFSSLTITLIFSAYAVGVVTSLFLAGHLSDRHGRRRWMVPAILLNIVSAAIFLTWSALPGLLLARFVGGLGVGIITATATAWIGELHAASRPGATPRRAQTVATAANLGGLGLGPLVGGVLSQWVGGPLTTPYVVALVALVVALVAVLASPETRDAVRPALPYRPQSIAVPADARTTFAAAALAAFIAFAALGLFTSLAPSFIAGTLHHASRALAGTAAFLVFTAAALAQTAAAARSVRALLSLGIAGMVAGPLLLILSVWLSSPSLGVFLVGGVVTGAGVGLLFKGAIATVVGVATEDRRAEALAGVFLAGYLGISAPVVGLGLITQWLSASTSLTIFAGLLVAGALVAARPLVGHRTERREPVPA
ncbi:MAG: MFS transporter [Solirubrobacteraceae bacterium]|nr:MFS transporter [Patulibacter sp.]